MFPIFFSGGMFTMQKSLWMVTIILIQSSSHLVIGTNIHDAAVE